MKSFEEFLESNEFKGRIHNARNRIDNADVELLVPRCGNSILINEGIIIPIDFKVTTLDLEELNSNNVFKNLNIIFTNNEDSFYKGGVINIGIKNVTNKTQLSSLIGHELIHAIQDERSKGKYLNYIHKLDNILKLKIRSGKYFLEDLKRLSGINNTSFLFKNPYERMAYAYQMVKEFKNNFSIGELIQLIQLLYPEFNKDKQFLKYLYQYYENIL